MKTEVIIAARGEIPENLQRTVNAALRESPVCVVYDGEECPRRGESPYRMKAADGLRVESPWKSPRGCGQARHYGITTSKADFVILTDGHMTFPEGWTDAITTHLRKNPCDVTCTKTISLTPKWDKLDGKVYFGAYLAAKTTEPQVDMSGPIVEHFALSAKWREDGLESGVVEAPMGACYGMRRAWYRKMGEPLSILEAWGCDEELLAMCGYLCGGRTYLIPITCGHMHAAPHAGRVIHPAGRWANRLALVDAIPDAAARTEYREWMRRTGVPWGVIDGLIDAKRAERVAALRAHLQGQARTWADLDAALIRVHDKDYRPNPGPVAQPTAPRREPPQVVVRRAEICRHCGAVNSFRQTAGPRQFGTFRQAYARCHRCGHKAHLRFCA